MKTVSTLAAYFRRFWSRDATSNFISSISYRYLVLINPSYCSFPIQCHYGFSEELYTHVVFRDKYKSSINFIRQYDDIITDTQTQLASNRSRPQAIASVYHMSHVGQASHKCVRLFRLTPRCGRPTAYRTRYTHRSHSEHSLLT